MWCTGFGTPVTKEHGVSYGPGSGYLASAIIWAKMPASRIPVARTNQASAVVVNGSHRRVVGSVVQIERKVVR